MWTEPIWILIALAFQVPAQGNPPVITNFPKEDLVKPEDVKFKSDLSFTLPCNATGSNLTWTWKHNGTAITDSSHFDLSEDGALTGKDLRAIHSGTYQCFVKDEVTGAVAFSRKLKVAVTVVGNFIDPKDDVVKVNLGESFYYDCPPHSYSYGVVYSWGNIGVSAQFTFARNERRSILSNGTLYITYLTQQDINDIESYDGIKCTISGANSFRSSGTLRLEKINENQTDSENSTSPSWLLTPNEKESAVEGKSKILYCFANGRPTPKITWKKDGREITDGQNSFSISPSFHERRLSIESVDETNHQGVYTCEAENAMNTGNPIISKTTLTIEVPPKWAANPPPNDITIVIEKNGTLECQVTANPAAIRTWYKNGEVLLPSGRLVLADNKLHLTDVNLEDTGVYQCEATNTHGTIISSTWVYVSVPPSLVTTPVNQTIMEGTTATFHCTVTGNPVPKITWTMNGKTVGSGETLSFETNRNQSGKYWCSANNGLDVIANASANLDVLYRPSLTTTPTNHTALEGTLATFLCVADGNLTPTITWKKDGKTLTHGDTLSFETNRTQSGEYVCSADTVSASAHLNVQYTTSLITKQGSYGSWKTWKVMEFRKKNSRPGKSWNFDQSHGKSWKIVII